ncbi:MAG: RNA methyltransferase [Bacteriovoracaceae bacterium]|nr:RNA methyltransferase [Bacteriovoracaceae bacterium]
MNYYLALVHAPVKNKLGEEVTTSVTNLDIHDIARSARTFGFKHYFIVTPITEQQVLVGRILGHWQTDTANEYNPDRQSALSYIKLVNTVAEAAAQIEALEGVKPLVVVTGANFKKYDGDEKALKQRIMLDNKPILLLFGTGWGLSDSLTNVADFKLEPIFGTAQDEYNHLSVRSAVAIYCDRLARN